MQLEAIASCPATGYLGEVTNTHLTTPSCQGAVESEKVPPQPPLLQTKQSSVAPHRTCSLEPSPASQVNDQPLASMHSPLKSESTFWLTYTGFPCSLQ